MKVKSFKYIFGCSQGVFSLSVVHLKMNMIELVLIGKILSKNNFLIGSDRNLKFT